MNIYIIAELILLALFFISKNKNKQLIFLISCFCLLCILGLHDGQFYNDYPEYLSFFLGNSSMYGTIDNPSFGIWEPGYVWYVRIVRLFGTYPFVYIFVTGLFFSSPFIFLMSRKKECAAFAVFFLLIYSKGEVFYYYLAAHRQILSTVFIMWAYCIYEFVNTTKLRKRILCVLFLTFALLSHSSAYLVIPLAIIIYITRNYNIPKIYFIVGLVVSMIVGYYLFALFSEQLKLLGIILDGNEAIARSVDQLSNDKNEDNTYYLSKYIFYTFFCGIIVFFSTKTELQSFSVRTLLFATITRNMFDAFPLFGRYVLFFYLVAFPLCCPRKIIVEIPRKLIMICFMMLYMYSAINSYVSKDSRILPYTFIFEN